MDSRTSRKERTMMEIEKKFATSNLNQFKVAPVEHFVKEVLKYQYWQTSKALERINYAPLKKISAEFYFNNIMRYLNGGKHTLSKSYVDLIEKYRNIVTPIEPETGSRRYSYQERPSRRKPIVSEIKKEPLVKSLIQNFIYAVRIDNMFMTFGSSGEAKAFTQGYKMANPMANVSEVHINSDAIEVIQ